MMNHEQQLPDDLDDTFGFGGGTPGGDDMDQQQHGMSNGHQQQMYQQKQQQNGQGNGVNLTENNELNVEQKLQLAERANEIYRQQLKYMQDHLASLRSLIQDKENIIENLMLRYDLGIITQDSNRQGGNLSADEIEMEELRRKAEALAQRTILENFELREMVNELRDENFHLRNEIYELQDKINRQVLQINKLEKGTAQQNMQRSNMGTDMMDMNGNYDDAEMEDDEEEDDDADIYDAEEDEDDMNAPQPTNDDEYNEQNDRTGGHGRRPSQQLDHPKNSEEAQAKREERANKQRKNSIKTPDIFNDRYSDEEDYMDEEAYQKRDERAKKAHKRDPSIPIPNIYGDQQGSSEEENSEEDETEPEQKAQLGTKRRDSKVFMDADAIKKREERSTKHHRKGTSTIPPMFDDNYDAEKYVKAKAQKYSPEATTKRLQRQAKKLANSAVKHVKKHRRKESLAEKLLLGPTTFGDDEFDMKSADPEKRKKLYSKARAEQRRKSQQMLQQQVGLKEHFSDDDIGDVEDKPQRAGFKTRQKASSRKEKQQQPPPQEYNDFDPNQPPPPQDSTIAGHKKRASRSGMPQIPAVEDAQDKHHRRDSSAPVAKLGFDDPDVLLHFEALKVKDLEAELEKKLDELDEVKEEFAKFKKSATTVQQKSNQESHVKTERDKFERDLDEAVQSKADLASKCAMEIMRLSMILNTLLQIPKFKETVQVLISESHKQNSKNGSLLG